MRVAETSTKKWAAETWIVVSLALPFMLLDGLLAEAQGKDARNEQTVVNAHKS